MSLSPDAREELASLIEITRRIHLAGQRLHKAANTGRMANMVADMKALHDAALDLEEWAKT